MNNRSKGCPLGKECSYPDCKKDDECFFYPPSEEEIFVYIKMIGEENIEY